MRIRELRLESGKTQNQLAEYLGISRSTYSAYERGKTMVSIAVLHMLADLYGVSTDYIVELTDVKEPHPRACAKAPLCKGSCQRS